MKKGDNNEDFFDTKKDTDSWYIAHNIIVNIGSL